MKVWQIVEAGEILGIDGQPLVDPRGNPIQRSKPKVTGDTDTGTNNKTPKKPKTPKPYSNPNTATGKIPYTDKKDIDIKAGKNGKLQVKILDAKGKKTVYKGSAKDILKQMGDAGDKGALRGLQRIGKSRGFFVKYAKTILRGASFLGAGYVGYEAIANWAEERAALRTLMGGEKGVFKGSNLDSNHPAYKGYMAYHTKAAAADVGQLIVTELGQWVAAGKIAKMLRYARALQVGLASTGWGAVIAALIWALMEGSQWLIGWWLRNYGADWFQNSLIEEMNKQDGDIIPPQKAPDVSDTEIKKEIKKAAGDSQDSVEDPTEVFKKWKEIKDNDDSGNISVPFNTD